MKKEILDYVKSNLGEEVDPAKLAVEATRNSRNMDIVDVFKEIVRFLEDNGYEHNEETDFYEKEKYTNATEQMQQTQDTKKMFDMFGEWITTGLVDKGDFKDYLKNRHVLHIFSTDFADLIQSRMKDFHSIQDYIIHLMILEEHQKGYVH